MLAPRFTQERCLILTDTDVESLLAAAMAAEQRDLGADQTSTLIPAWWGPSDRDIDLLISAIDPAATQQAALLALNIEPQHALYPPDDEPAGHNTDTDLGQHQTRLLTEAAYLAMRAGLRKLVWPIRIPDDHPDRVGAIATTLDRALLVARTVSLDASTQTAPDITIDTPFIDLTTEQITDLARDMALPTETCWWNSTNPHPIADQQREQWAAIDNRSATQLEPKPNAPQPQPRA